jgi:putative redox protein
MDALSIMAKKRQTVERYEVVVSGRQREEHPRTFTDIDVEHVVEGRGLDDAAVARAIELSARRYCVVGASLAAGDTSIRHRSRIRDEAGERTCDCITIGPLGAGLTIREAVPG